MKIIVLVGCLFFSAPVSAWWAGGHELIARTAVHALPKEMPEFFRNSEEEIAHAANDPDVFKVPGSLVLQAREEPAHFIDLELLQGAKLPGTWIDYQNWIQEKKIDLQFIGFLPYAVVEWTERLSVCFAEHRKFVRSRIVRVKCALQAGILAHYVGDLQQPLHTTIHHDGKNMDPKNPVKTGIHALVDGVLEKLRLKPAQIHTNMPKIMPYSELFEAVGDELRRSHAQVAKVYELEPLFRGFTGAPDKGDPKLNEWAIERAKAAAVMLARLYVTAWDKSAKINLPNWLTKR